ncbi:ISCpe6, transposase OrfA [Clostridium butyricum E4 str. BoNT E BL5262]|uniref:ISCpe6, transposase OrfA n=1 Tax=Clostridium butyricum E4 str. BoNT E BL5262 TaxID=632245 RepID=C4IM20_CLOBU|nr:ISCpe6, transposase OrfA [Clostridium butyricum E4 str. BoNT E BL5262]
MDLEARDNILIADNYKGYKKGSRSIKMVLENEFFVIYRRKKLNVS